MERLNYGHLLYFWMVAREGTVARAAAQLRLAQPTLSGQIRALEGNLGEKLFEQPVRLEVHVASTEKLLAALALHDVDVVLTDRVAPPGVSVRAFNHLLGDCGVTLFAASAQARKSVRKQYGVAVVGRLDKVRERFYAVSAERRLEHPAVIAITESARRELFG